MMLKNIMILMLLIVTSNLFGEGKMSIINDIGIYSGQRGTAITINSNGKIEADISGKNNEVTISIKNCIYGLDKFRFEAFPKNSPVKCIHAIEKKKGKININIITKNTVSLPIKTKVKDGQYLALLSKNAVKEYTWNSNTDKSNINRTVAVINKQTDSKAYLKNIRLLERDNISELAFEFSKDVSGTIKRNKKVITLNVENAENRIGKKELDIPTKEIFDRVEINEYKKNKISSIQITFPINIKNIDTSLNVAITKGKILSIYVMKRENKKATLWTSGHGMSVDYKFYDVPSYNVDMKSIGKRAEKDAKKSIHRNGVFSIKKDKKKIENVKSKNTEDNTIQTAKRNKNEENHIKEPEKSVNKLKMIKINPEKGTLVNIRKKPTIQSKVINKLHAGDSALLIEKEKKWSKVLKGRDTGYIYNTLIVEMEKKIINKSKTIDNSVAINEKANEDIENNNALSGIQQVSKTTISEKETEDKSELSIQIDKINEEIPKMKKHVIKYRGGGRDPFMPLVEDTIGLEDMPYVENLNLVGVLINDVDKIALCEDEKNKKRPFNFRERDRVRNGRVLRIYKDKVVFLLTEYGISRSYTLSLSNKMEASKK